MTSVRCCALRVLRRSGVFGILLLASSCIAQVQPTVQLLNLSRTSATDFYVGETWEIIVYGDPSQPVSDYATFNGTPLGTTPDGNTDGSGYFIISGTMPDSAVGSWTETWYVNGVAASPSLSFEVEGAPADPCSMDVYPNPLVLYSTDYFVGDMYAYSVLGEGEQDGEGEAPYCSVYGANAWSTDYIEGFVSYPSAWAADTVWEDPFTTREAYPYIEYTFADYYGTDLRDGTPFYGAGDISLVVNSADLY